MKPSDVNGAYAELAGRFGTAMKLGAARSLLFWDSQTYMPAGGAWGRGEQIAALDVTASGLIARPDATELFASAQAEADALTPIERANLAEMHRVWRHRAAVPADLVSAKARVCASLQGDWVAARASDDFDRFAKGFAELLPLHRQIAAAKGEALGMTPYDALMDEADPGLTSALADPIFAELERELPPLLAEVTERQAGWPSPIPFSGDFSIERQKALSNELLAAVGHTDDQCRIDIVPHPFSMVGLPGDVRITTRYDLADFRFAIMATIHEAGHALYESGLPRARAFQPIGAARGATAHESQALMAEMQAGRSPEFLRFLAPRLAAAFGDGECWAYANVLNAFRRLNTGHLRVAADEISYPLHVLLRYRLERALLSGDLEVSELPGAWSDMSQRLLGRAPPRHSLGCLQDMHWAIGMFGYFPNYALGAVLAAQLFERAVGDDPSVSERLAYGDYGPYRDWVRPRIHARGSEVPFSELVEDATGGPLLAAALLRHLKRRYLEEPGPSALS